MKVLRLLAIGWLAGAGFIVALDVTARAVFTARTAGRRVPATARVATHASGSSTLIPVAGVGVSDLRDTFGDARSGGRRHAAIDIFAPVGTPVIASVDGTVQKLFTSRAGGLTIYQFDRDSRHVYYYAHLDRYRDGLAEGMFVRRGETIGFVGRTGNVGSATSHLHFAIEQLPPTKEWWKGSPVNPYPILTGAQALDGVAPVSQTAH